MATVYLDGIEQEVPDGFFGPDVTISPPAPRPGVPTLVATANLGVIDGMVTGVETASGFYAAFAIKPDVYWVFFSEEQPDLSYSYSVMASAGIVNVTQRETYMMEIRTSQAELPAGPFEISIQVTRLV